MRTLPLYLATVPLFLASCATGATAKELRTRAAYELNCPDESLKLTELDDTTMGVEGCGQRAVYVKDCGYDPNHRERCRWVANTVTTESKPAAPSPATP